MIFLDSVYGFNFFLDSVYGFNFLPRNLRTLMRKAMDYITSSTPCVTFVPATSSSVNYVLITPGARCSSELGMRGGEQVIYLNSACLTAG